MSNLRFVTLWCTCVVCPLVVLLCVLSLVNVRAAPVARFQVGQTYNVVWNCIPEGLSSLADYMITQAGGPDSETLCRQEVLTVTAVGEDGFLDVYDQREKDKLDEAGHKAKPHPWVVNPAMMQAWTRVVPKAER